jgi:hypothetical protein
VGAYVNAHVKSGVIPPQDSSFSLFNKKLKLIKGYIEERREDIKKREKIK